MAAGGAGPDEVDVGGGLLLFLGGGHGGGGGHQVVLHGAHVVEAVAPCHGRAVDDRRSISHPLISLSIRPPAASLASHHARPRAQPSSSLDKGDRRRGGST